MRFSKRSAFVSFVMEIFGHDVDILAALLLFALSSKKPLSLSNLVSSIFGVGRGVGDCDGDGVSVGRGVGDCDGDGVGVGSGVGSGVGDCDGGG